MSPSKSLNMITGETGAGKSIMLGAVGLLLGNRSDTKALSNPDKKCVVEGLFEITDYGLDDFFRQEDLDFDKECIIRREISPSGKSRAFINDTPVKLEVLKELGKHLMDIHSQHDTLRLADGGYQLNIVDYFSQTAKEKEEFGEAFKEFSKSKKHLQTRIQEAQDLKKEADFNKFQLEEISNLKLQEGEQTELESEQEVLENAEEIKGKIQEVLGNLHNEQYGAMRTLTLINHNIQQLTRLTSRFESYSDRFQSVLIELKDIASTIEEEDNTIEVDFEKLEIVRERLSKIYHLQQKHGLDSVEQLIELENALSDKVFKIEHLDDEINELKKSNTEAEQKMLSKAHILSEKRKASFDSFSKELEKLLKLLGMENAQIKMVHQVITPTINGIDQIDIQFSANKGVATQPLKQVASGGEFSRLIFAIKFILADKMAMPTLIFDEIDSGVSGEIALQMVRMMQEISKRHQVICISHLPQVAAKGDKHYFVYKDNSSQKTISKIKLLNQEERIAEIAKMIAGANPSSTAFENAKELLSN